MTTITPLRLSVYSTLVVHIAWLASLILATLISVIIFGMIMVFYKFETQYLQTFIFTLLSPIVFFITVILSVISIHMALGWFLRARQTKYNIHLYKAHQIQSFKGKALAAITWGYIWRMATITIFNTVVASFLSFQEPNAVSIIATIVIGLILNVLNFLWLYKFPLGKTRIVFGNPKVIA